jgi:hypothetical protein
MPAHTFQRVGLYAYASEANRRAADVDQRYLQLLAAGRAENNFAPVARGSGISKPSAVRRRALLSCALASRRVSAIGTTS